MAELNFDVAVVGGGPGGSTFASILRKYAPQMSVAIFEREEFPRDHVGESQLPPISRILDEIGVWDKVEAANFPIKLGATYKWGKTKDLWDFEFYPAEKFIDEQRPSKFEGQRRWTAFQVDRAEYDKILLDHAKELGSQVFQPSRVLKVNHENDQITSLDLENGDTVTAKWYIDASGHVGLLRRSLGVEAPPSTLLQNVAFWDYWQNTDWAVSIGVGGTRVQVLSLGYGWIWFIPLGPTRTSIGLVIPADYYKKSGKSPEELYQQALKDEPLLQQLIQNASSEGKFSTTKDWSFCADRAVGKNWFLIGEACGFADPILAAGLTLTQVSAREAAISIIEIERKSHEEGWVKNEYETRQLSRIKSHIRFAEYWYTANSQFKDLQGFTSEIAKDSNLDLSPQKAWQWLAQGGFVDPDGQLGIAGFGTEQILKLGDFLQEVGTTPVVKTCNVYKLNLDGAEWRPAARYGAGTITQGGAYYRGDRVLPLVDVLAEVVKFLTATDNLPTLIEYIKGSMTRHKDNKFYLNEIIGRIPHAIEAMVADGWIEASFDPKYGMQNLPERVGNILHWNTDNVLSIQ